MSAVHAGRRESCLVKVLDRMRLSRADAHATHRAESATSRSARRRPRLAARRCRPSARAITYFVICETTSRAEACGAVQIDTAARTVKKSGAVRKENAMPNKISTVRESLYRCIDTTFCCEKCAYRGKSRCMRALMIDAFDAIGALNQKNDQLRTQLRQAAAGADRLSVFERIAQYFRRKRRHDK